MKRYANNPLLSPQRMVGMSIEGFTTSALLSPGIARINDAHKLFFIVQDRARLRHVARAIGSDGFRFDSEPRTLNLTRPDQVSPEAPPQELRVSPLEGEIYLMVRYHEGGRSLLAIYREETEELCGVCEGDIGVLFPRRVDGRFLLLKRLGNDLVLTRSKDLGDWEEPRPVLTGRPGYWDERLAPGPHPLPTEHGWLLLYQGAWIQEGSVPITAAGCALLDATDPTHVLERSRANLLEPRESYELAGFQPNSVQVSGWLVTDPKGRKSGRRGVLIYYAAAGMHLCLATSGLEALHSAAAGIVQPRGLM